MREEEIIKLINQAIAENLLLAEELVKIKD